VLKDTTGTEAPVPQRKTIDLTSNDGNNKKVEGGVTTTPSGKLLSTPRPTRRAADTEARPVLQMADRR
jgi:hypothetical protein